MLNKESLQSSATSTAKSLLLHVSFSSRNTTLSLYQTKSGLTVYGIRQQPAGEYDVKLPFQHPLLDPLPSTFWIRLSPSSQLTPMLTYDENYLALVNDTIASRREFQVLRSGETDLQVVVHDL